MPDWIASFLAAATLGAGWNATIATVGAAMLGVAAGAVGSFAFLRRRALIADVAAHAALPGLAIAFLLMVALGGDGRALPGLLLGATASALLGVVAVEWISRATRLAEDAAMGAVLSVFFGAGIVLLTLIQGMTAGRAAGLEGFLLGAAAGMLWEDAVTIAGGGALALAAVVALRRPMTLAAFDPGFAASVGVNLRRTDLAVMALALGITVIGLKVAGLILIVALLVIPPVAARFWTDRAERMAMLSAAIGGASAWAGVAVSAAAPQVPTGPAIVLSAFAVFAVSMIAAPGRGVAAAAWRRRRFGATLARRRAVLALGGPTFEGGFLERASLDGAPHDKAFSGGTFGDPDPPDRRDARARARLMREGLVGPDGAPTEAGLAEAARLRVDEARRRVLHLLGGEGAAARDDGVTPLTELLTADELAELDRRRGAPA